METFKDRIKQARVNSGMSQQDLADKIGVTKQSISQYERGIRKPDMDTLTALGDILNLSIDYITGVSDVTMRFLTTEDLKRLAIPPKEYSKEEIEMIDAYRTAPLNIQIAIRSLLNIT